MKFGLGLPGIITYPPVMSRWEPDAGAAEIIRYARHGDELGYDWITVPEHIIIPREMLEVMGPRFPEALTASAVLAGATKQIKILTYVLVLPYRNPIFLAKQIATLDFLSGGRFILGTAVGHMEREFEVLGVPFAERGAMSDEYLRAMKELWTSPTPSFHGKYVQFDEIVFEPKPAQPPPIFIGGNSPPAMRRAATLGDGWLPWLVKRDELPEKLDYLRAQPGFAEPFEVVMPLANLNIEDYSHKELGRSRAPKTRDEIVEQIGLLGEAGATAVLAAPPKTPRLEDALDWCSWFAQEIMPAVR